VIKVVSTFLATPDRPPADADAHYLTQHVPLVTQVLNETPGALGYVQNRVTRPVAFDFNRPEARDVEPLFDWMVEFWFESHAARHRMAEHRLMPRVMADHPNFMHAASERCMEYYLVDEHVALPPPRR
jgi:hypothetical protein